MSAPSPQTTHASTYITIAAGSLAFAGAVGAATWRAHKLGWFRRLAGRVATGQATDLEKQQFQEEVRVSLTANISAHAAATGLVHIGRREEASRLHQETQAAEHRSSVVAERETVKKANIANHDAFTGLRDIGRAEEAARPNENMQATENNPGAVKNPPPSTSISLPTTSDPLPSTPNPRRSTSSPRRPTSSPRPSTSSTRPSTSSTRRSTSSTRPSPSSRRPSISSNTSYESAQTHQSHVSGGVDNSSQSSGGRPELPTASRVGGQQAG